MKKYKATEYDILLPKKWRYNRIYFDSPAWWLVVGAEIFIGIGSFFFLTVLAVIVGGTI